MPMLLFKCTSHYTIPCSAGLSSWVTSAIRYGSSITILSILNRQSPVTSRVYRGLGQLVPVTCTTTAPVPMACNNDSSS